MAVPAGTLALAPAYLLRSIRHPEYRAHLSERFGFLAEALRARLDALPRRPVWIQAVSVGEVFVARTLLHEIGAAGGERGTGSPIPFVLSSTTPAGRQAASRLGTPAVEGTFHFPIDWPPFVRRALDVIRPSAYISVETEIWPAFLSECGRRRLPVLIVNGRISRRSGLWYARLGRMMGEPLSSVRLACMQSEADAERLRAAGVAADRVVVTGNLKFDDGVREPPDAGEPSRLREMLGVPADRRVIVAGSTSPGEEELVLDAFGRLDPDRLTLVLAPRHPARFDDVARLLRRRGLPFVRRSALPGDSVQPIILLDTVGELRRLYAVAEAAFVGGSLVPRGGQNMIEPAAAGVPALFGPHTENFGSVAEALVAVGAGFRVRDADHLAKTIGRLLRDDTLRRRSAAAGKALVEANRGAAGRTAGHIRPWLG